MKTVLCLMAVVFLLTSYPSLAWDYVWWPRCQGPSVISTLISSRSEFTTTICEIGDPLVLSRINHFYPILGELTVDYWQGSFTRQAVAFESYQDNVYDCSGRLQNSSKRAITRPFLETFALDNPNLHDDVSMSFLANA